MAAWLTAAPLIAFVFSFEIPPVSVSLNVAGQPVPITVAGTIAESGSGAAAATRLLEFHLRTGLAGLQDHITPVLQTILNKSERCGDRISIQSAELAPVPPAARLTVQLHFEKFACLKVLGKENAKRLVGGNGSIQLLVTPMIEQGNAIRLGAEVEKIDADGSLGELLRSGSLGTALRDKIRESLLKALEKSSGFETALPAEAQPYITISSAVFAADADGRLLLNTGGKLLAPAGKISSLLEQFRNRP